MQYLYYVFFFFQVRVYPFIIYLLNVELHKNKICLLFYGQTIILAMRDKMNHHSCQEGLWRSAIMHVSPTCLVTESTTLPTQVTQWKG